MWAHSLKTIAIVATAFIATTAFAADKTPAKKKSATQPQKGAGEKVDSAKSDAQKADAATKTDENRAANETPAAGSGADDTEHAIKLRGLEERVNDLKERIFRSKARLILLRETVLNGVISGAKAVIVHRNEMGSSFALESVAYALDGAPIYNKTDAHGDLDEKEEIELFNGSIVPGNHNLSVFMVYRGNGYGVFSYLKGYQFKIKSSYAFTAEEGKVTTVKIVGYEKGGITTDLKDRPAIRYDVEVKQDTNAPGPASGAQPASTKAEAPAKK
jgi:hypothetical protein